MEKFCNQIFFFTRVHNLEDKVSCFQRTKLLYALSNMDDRTDGSYNCLLLSKFWSGDFMLIDYSIIHGTNKVFFFLLKIDFRWRVLVSRLPIPTWRSSLSMWLYSVSAYLVHDPRGPRDFGGLSRCSQIPHQCRLPSQSTCASNSIP